MCEDAIYSVFARRKLISFPSILVGTLADRTMNRLGRQTRMANALQKGHHDARVKKQSPSAPTPVTPSVRPAHADEGICSLQAEVHHLDISCQRSFESAHISIYHNHPVGDFKPLSKAPVKISGHRQPDRITRAAALSGGVLKLLSRRRSKTEGRA